MASREEVIMALRHKGYKGEIPQPKMAPIQSQTEAPDEMAGVRSLIEQYTPKRNLLQNVARSAYTANTGKDFPAQEGESTVNKLLDTVLGEKAKAMFRDPLEQENIRSQIESRKSASDARKQGELLFGGYQDDGSPIWITPPDDRKVKNVSPGLTNPYQERAVAQADLARQEADLARSAGASFQGGQPGQQPNQQGQGNLPGGANPNATPGTKLNVGPYSIPVNPELTETEARTFSAIASIQKSVDQILASVKEGTGNQGNLAQNAYSGVAIDSGFSPATFGQDKLQGLQSAMNQLKRDTLFTDAGKALTAGERQIVERLFNVSGKSPEQIAIDIPNGVQKFYDFVKAKQGGMYGYNPFQNQSQPTGGSFDGQSDEELTAELQRLQGGQ